MNIDFWSFELGVISGMITMTLIAVGVVLITTRWLIAQDKPTEEQ